MKKPTKNDYDKLGREIVKRDQPPCRCNRTASETPGHARGLRKRSPAKTLWRQLYRDTEEAWKAACRRRDKNTCQLCHRKKSPEVILQVDHFVRRGHQVTFFDPRNGTTLCVSCHTNKTWGNYGTDYRVAKIVEKREGEAVVAELLATSHVLKKWTVGELEEQLRYLNGLWV